MRGEVLVSCSCPTDETDNPADLRQVRGTIAKYILKPPPPSASLARRAGGLPTTRTSLGGPLSDRLHDLLRGALVRGLNQVAAIDEELVAVDELGLV